MSRSQLGSSSDATSASLTAASSGGSVSVGSSLPLLVSSPSSPQPVRASGRTHGCGQESELHVRSEPHDPSAVRQFRTTGRAGRRTVASCSDVSIVWPASPRASPPARPPVPLPRVVNADGLGERAVRLDGERPTDDVGPHLADARRSSASIALSRSVSSTLPRMIWTNPAWSEPPSRKSVTSSQSWNSIAPSIRAASFSANAPCSGRSELAIAASRESKRITPTNMPSSVKPKVPPSQPVRAGRHVTTPIARESADFVLPGAVALHNLDEHVASY